MGFTIGLNIGDDGKILIHIRSPEDEGFTRPPRRRCGRRRRSSSCTS